MRELSLHIMDLAQNCVKAGASLMELRVEEDDQKDSLLISIKDNGCGMDEEFARRVESPFTTTRTTRKVGLGIPMFKENALLTGGDFHLTTKKGVGTEICAVFVLSSIDRMPMGDLAGTVLLLVQANPKMDIRLDVRVNENSYSFDTREVRQVLGDDVPLDLPEVSAWMQENLTEGIEALHGGM